MGKYSFFVLTLILLHVLHGDSLKMEMKMIHRHSIHSPIYSHFSSRHQAIQSLISLDSLRISSHHAQSMAPASPPEGSNVGPVTEFEMPIASAATLGTALYFVELYVGTPPQKILPVADTGSNLVWVNCNPCQNCSFFNPNISSSLSYVPCFSRECHGLSPTLSCIFRPKMACKYSYGYMDNSSTIGAYMHETVTLNSTSGKPLKAENVLMGCGLDNQGQTEIGSAGVLGLGQGPNSFAIQTASFYGGKFSYCLRDYLEPATVKSSLVFGDMIQESGPSLLRKPIQYTPILQGGSTFYYVGIEEIAINGEKLPISISTWEIDEFGNGGTIIDSGTSLTYLAEDAYETILEALNVTITYPRATTLSPQQFDLCFNTSGVSELKLPEFSIVLEGGKTFSPPPENYILQVEDDVRCLGLRPITAPSPSIIGNLLQQNFFVQYNVQQSLLGFAPADCSVHK